MDKALGLTVGFRGIGFGADVFETEVFAGVPEGQGPVARSVIGHDPFDSDIEAPVPSEGGVQEGDGTVFFLVWQDVCEAEAGVVVDADVDVFPAPVGSASWAGSIAVYAVPDLVEAAEFLDIDVDHLAGPGAFVAAYRFGRVEVAPAVEAVAGQDPSHRGFGNTNFGGDAVIDAPLLAQGNHLRLKLIGCSMGTGKGP